jgi:DNA (cytosine-5)-methyltransferase 1
MTKRERTLISLFAGAGGLDLGLEQAGFKTKVATDYNPFCCETLRRNKVIQSLSDTDLEDYIEELLRLKCFSTKNIADWRGFFNRLKSRDGLNFLQDAKIIERDVRLITSKELTDAVGGPVFCISGGPPCQPFSKAGKRKNLDDEKNGALFSEFVRIVSDIKPDWFLFENVKGLSFTQTEMLYVNCLSCDAQELTTFEKRQTFDSAEQSPPCKNCNSSNTEWQHRTKRGGSLEIIIKEFESIGYRCHWRALNAANYGVPQLRDRLFIVGSLKGKDFTWPSPSHQKRNQTDQLSLHDMAMPDWRTLRDELGAELELEFGKPLDEKFALWVKNVVRPHDEPVTWNLDRPSPTIGAHQGAKLAFAPKGVPEAQLARQQWTTLGRRQGDTAPVKVNHRYLSDEELLRIQCFPKSWYLHGTRMERAFQIGNAVPPLLAKAVGQAIIRAEEAK